MVSVRKIMTKGIQKLDSDMNVKEAAKLMKAHKIGCLLVESDGKLTGIVTETDIVRCIVADGMSPDNTQVKSIMSSPLITIDVEKSVIDANDLMDKHNIRHLAVTEDDVIIGVVSSRDIMHPLYMDGQEW